MPVQKTYSSFLATGSRLTLLAMSVAFLPPAQASEKAIALKDAPAGVQKAINEQLKGGTLRALSVEVEKGETRYEAEMTINGHARDVVMDATGAVVEAEATVEMSALPSAIRESLLKEAGKGKIERVEEVTRGGVLTYEALVKEAGKKNREVLLDSSGKVPAKK